MTVKYSIVIPSYNGCEYLKSCVCSIVSQSCENYELIISDDHSVDDTASYLQSLQSNSKIKVISPSERLSMTEHWEWALSHAQGEWLIFVGQDDAVQPYFFSLADKLTTVASERGIRAIMSERAYFFWDGCQAVYGDVSVSYVASPKLKVLNSALEATKALLGIVDYFELPQMYTTSLFHRSLLDEAKKRQNDKVFSCHPQDANLAAIACSLEPRFLKSYIPLGWVGSSPKSAGMAVAANDDALNGASALKELKADYEEKIQKSKLKYNARAGNFALSDLPIYFWQALIETPGLRSNWVNKFLTSRVFGAIFFSLLLIRIWRPKSQKKKMLMEIFDANGLRPIWLIPLCAFMLLLVFACKILFFVFRVIRKLFSFVLCKEKIFLRMNRTDFPDVLPEDASKEVSKMISPYLQRIGF
ncbi:glycosyltransferase family 2 protein [Ectopseudomonas toyotomiensis]|uniref:glycosyltransferase family 2 protein n=1 Tax=Ectopseudomonas toyotomiensis TaxID=554344 RepID=UPI0037C60573